MGTVMVSMSLEMKPYQLEGGLCHKDSLRLPHRSEVVDSHKWPLMRIGKPGHPSEFPWIQSNLPFLARESQVCEALNVLC